MFDALSPVQAVERFRHRHNRVRQTFYCSELLEWMAVKHKQQALRRQQWPAMRPQCVLSDMPQGVSARQPPN
jgi:hypothetical protein